MTFDGDNWIPITKPSAPSSDVQFFLPPERQPTHPGWVVTTAPNTLTIQFNGPGAPNTWTFHPRLATQKRQLNRLIYIPFRPLNSSTTTGPRITFTASTMQYFRVPGFDVDLRRFIWDETRMLADRHHDNDVAQAVDWAYKSSPSELKAACRLRAVASLWTPFPTAQPLRFSVSLTSGHSACSTSCPLLTARGGHHRSLM